MTDYLKMFALMVAVAVTAGVIVMKISIFQAGEPIAVPAVAGKEVIPALELLDRSGLYLKVVRLDYSSVVPKDRIISQDPLPGERVKKGRDVRVVISRGTKNVLAPELAGSSIRRAETILAKNGINIRKRMQVYSNEPEGTILAQKPAAQSILVRGDAVTLVISSGPYPEYVDAPDLIGAPVNDAMGQVKSLGVKISQVSYEPSPGASRGVVLTQSPIPGAKMRNSTFMSMVVSEGVASTQDHPATMAFLYFTVPDGPSSATVSVTQDNVEGEKEIYNRIHRPGDTFSILVTVKGATTAKIFLNGELAEARTY
jgi:serine/threonine-protein kinase